jgi:hypothetical protein
MSMFRFHSCTLYVLYNGDKCLGDFMRFVVCCHPRGPPLTYHGSGCVGSEVGAGEGSEGVAEEDGETDEGEPCGDARPAEGETDFVDLEDVSLEGHKAHKHPEEQGGGGKRLDADELVDGVGLGAGAPLQALA